MVAAQYALVVSILMTSGEPQDAVVDVYPSYSTCREAADQLKTDANCYQIERVIHRSETPEELTDTTQ